MTPSSNGLGLLTATAEATEAAAAVLGARLRPGDVVSLDGPLGAGKTVFVRGLARGRGLDPALVRSPTFVFHHVYGSPARLHHLDLYRLGEGARVDFLDIDGLLETAPAAVEWGGLNGLREWNPLRLSIEVLQGGESRVIEVVDPGGAPPQLLTAWHEVVGGR